MTPDLTTRALRAINLAIGFTLHTPDSVITKLACNLEQAYLDRDTVLMLDLCDYIEALV